MLSPSTNATESVADVVRADDERLRQAVGLVLDRVADVDAEHGAVAQQSVKCRGVVWGGDQQNVPDARHHERRQRVVDHRFVVDGQQLLADAHGDGVHPRAEPPARMIPRICKPQAVK